MSDEGTKARQSGFKLQERARKLLRVPDREFGASNLDEELWNSAVQFEVKSGKQVDKIASHFFRVEDEVDRKIKNTEGVEKNKPFAMICMPSGTGDGILLTRISDLEGLVEGLLTNWNKEKENGLDKE
tara:strand:+ start:1211 stop:1594 length:384 start_codon:yes stop_codon:yes gene_type:complete